MSWVPLLYTLSGEIKRSKVPCLKNQHNGQGLNLGLPDPEFEVLTAQPHMPPQLFRVSPTLSCAADFFKLSHVFIAD